VLKVTIAACDERLVLRKEGTPTSIETADPLKVGWKGKVEAEVIIVAASITPVS